MPRKKQELKTSKAEIGQMVIVTMKTQGWKVFEDYLLKELNTAILGLENSDGGSDQNFRYWQGRIKQCKDLFYKIEEWKKDATSQRIE